MKTETFLLNEVPTRYFTNDNNQKYLFFGGTAYLGLSTNKDFQQIYREGVEKYGLNVGTSRLNNVCLALYNEAECILAERFGTEDSLLSSSGYLASQLAIQTLSKKVAQVFIAPKTHPANILTYPKTSIQQPRKEWEQTTLKSILTSGEETFIIISNTIDNLFPELYSYDWLEEVPKNKKIILILDDSHGLGIIHENKPTVLPKSIYNKNVELVVVASLAKGMGTDAGIILGSKETLDLLREHPIYIGASPPSPAAIHTLIKGNDIYKSERNKLMENINVAAIQLGTQFSQLSKFPVFTYKKSSLYPYLVSKGIVISSFPYPLNTDPSLDRIIISSLHQHKDIKKLIEAIHLSKT